MKKYELIKEYPFSPRLGFVLTATNDWDNTFKKAHLYPEYWEEGVEKDYEILSFIVDSNKQILSRRQNGLFVSDFFKEIDGCYSEEDILSNDPKRVEWEEDGDDDYGYSIHSVERLSDGEIFTVGDRIKIETWDESCIILNFKIINNILTFELKDSEASADYTNLSDFIKTDDGVGIYEGDSYFAEEDINEKKFSLQDIKNVFGNEGVDKIRKNLLRQQEDKS